MKSKEIIITIIIAILMVSTEAFSITGGGGLFIDADKYEQEEQVEDASSSDDEDSDETEEREHIESFSGLTIRPYLLVPIQFFTVGHSDADDITYQPNHMVSVGAGISWWILGFSYHMSLPGTFKDRDLYGETEYQDFMFNFYFRKLGIDLFYKNYEGFYLEDPSDYGMQQTNPEVIKPNLMIRTFGINIFWVFSDDYSYDAAFKQSERQNNWGGSFILMFSIIDYFIKNDTSLIPSTVDLYSNYEDGTGFRRGHFTSFGISPGYAYTFIFADNLYIAPSLCLGTGLMRKYYKGTTGSHVDYGSFLKINFRMGIGWNSDNWYTGVAFIMDVTNSQSFLSGSGIAISSFSGSLEFFYGRRF